MNWNSSPRSSDWGGWDNSSNYYQQRNYVPPNERTVQIIDNPLTPEIAIDCEMVEATSFDRKRFNALARVSIVNSMCQPIIDTYVDPMHYVSDFRTPYSGIRPEHLANAPSYNVVRDAVIKVIIGRTVIGHDLKQDLAVLDIKSLQGIELRDTSSCYMSYFKQNERPSLKRLAQAVLHQTIQIGPHDSMEDAIASMKLYKRWMSSLER